MIGDYETNQQEFPRCKCGRNHEGLYRQRSEKVFRYRGYKGIVKFFQKDGILPMADVTHFALGNAIVGLSLLDKYHIVSKPILNRERLLFVSNSTDSEYITFCHDFWREIKE